LQGLKPNRGPYRHSLTALPISCGSMSPIFRLLTCILPLVLKVAGVDLALTEKEFEEQEAAEIDFLRTELLQTRLTEKITAASLPEAHYSMMNGTGFDALWAIELAADVNRVDQIAGPLGMACVNVNMPLVARNLVKGKTCAWSELMTPNPASASCGCFLGMMDGLERVGKKCGVPLNLPPSLKQRRSKCSDSSTGSSSNSGSSTGSSSNSISSTGSGDGGDDSAALQQQWNEAKSKCAGAVPNCHKCVASSQCEGFGTMGEHNGQKYPQVYCCPRLKHCVDRRNGGGCSASQIEKDGPICPDTRTCREPTTDPHNLKIYPFEPVCVKGCPKWNPLTYEVTC